MRTATDVRMDVVCAKKHGLARLQLDEVQEEHNEQTNVARKLAVQARQNLSKHLAARSRSGLASCKALILLLDLRQQLFACGLDVLLF